MLVLGVILFYAVRAAAADFSSNATGTSGSDFLTLDSGARGIAMGGAVSALVNDASSMYWNPAGLAQVPRLSAMMAHNSYVAGINFEYLAYAQRLNPSSVLGGSIQYLDAGSVANTDINGNTQGTFRPRSYAYALGFAQLVPEVLEADAELAIGVTGKLLRSSMIESANGFAMDIGAQVHHSHSEIPHGFSFVVENIGQGQKFDKTRSSLPLIVKAGGAAALTESLSAASDITFPMAGAAYAAFGGEFGVKPDPNVKVAFRSGLNTQFLTGGLDGFRGINLGFGVTFSNMTLDYAFAPMGTLGYTHRISLSFNLPTYQSLGAP